MGLFNWRSNKRANADATAATQLWDMRSRVQGTRRRDHHGGPPKRGEYYVDYPPTYTYVMHVINAYQDAQDGTKARVQVEGLADTSDAWFWWKRVVNGQVLAVEASIYYGRHNDEPDVFYVGRQDGSAEAILDVLPPGTAMGAWRHEQRLAKAATRQAV